MPRFVRVAEAREILNGTSKVVEIEGLKLAIFNVDGTFAAVESTCPHLGGPLGEGEFKEGIVKCPWHGWTFDPLTGASPLNPEASIQCYPVRLDGGDIYVDLEGGNGER